MVFSSFTFLFYFLPVFLAVYFLVPAVWKNAVIFGASLVFYYYGIKDRPAYVLLMLAALAVNYAASGKIEQCDTERMRRFWLIVGLVYNFGILFIFKYIDFLVENLNRVIGWFGDGISLPYAEFILPVGISFYTFQISSYLIDVYRKKIPAEHSILTLGTYLCMFPQLIAGPIVTYSQVREQLKERRHSFADFEEGIRTFTIGLAMKVLIANRLGGLWNQMGAIGYDSISTPLAWLGILGFSFQIYFDFYGYSLMAKGLGRIMGFSFPDNFKDPYLACSMTDFWRRWHITLGSWFREYVYIPLGGNRRHKFRNLFLVWLLTGLWHGAGWNFVLWGMFSFLLISVEKCGPGRFLEKVRPLGHLYMLVVIPVSWLLFTVPDMGQFVIYLDRLFPFAGQAAGVVYAGDFLKYAKLYIWPLIAAVLCSTGIPGKIYAEKKYSLPVTLLLVILFWGCVYSMYLGLDDPFLYYQF